MRVALVIDLSGLLDLVHVVVGPVAHCGDDPAQTIPEGGERVLDFGWDGRVHVAVNDPVSFQCSKGLGEHLLADPLDLRAQMGEAQGAFAEGVEDEQRPLVPNPANDLASRTRRGHDVVAPVRRTQFQAISHHMVCIPQTTAYFPSATTSSILNFVRAIVPVLARTPSVELAEVDEPEAASDEVIVAVEAFSPNRGESFLLENPPPGWRPGKDVAGIVVRASELGQGPAVGQRVVAHPERSGWAERVAVPLDKVTALPADMPFTTAAALPLAGLTALRLTRVTGPLASRRILLTGASGGVGHYFVELGASQGADITVVTASEERGARLVELGAAESRRRVADATGSYHIGLESVGGEVTAAVWAKLVNDGLLVWFGQASRVPPTLNFFNWRGGLSGTIRKFAYSDSDTSDADDLATLVRLVHAGRLHPEIGLVADWEHTAEAIEAMVGQRAGQGSAHSPREFGHPRQHIGSKIARVQTIMILRAKQGFQSYLDTLVFGVIETLTSRYEKAGSNRIFVGHPPLLTELIFRVGM